MGMFSWHCTDESFLIESVLFCVVCEYCIMTQAICKDERVKGENEGQQALVI